jgi:hypothetical protein
LLENMMRIYFILALLCPLAVAKEAQVSCNVVPDCKTQWQSPVRQAQPPLQFDCSLAWAKVSKTQEAQWQRLSIDY